MFSASRKSEAAQRSLERRQREDAAPRLAAEVPNLETLVVKFREGVPASPSPFEHVRRVQVATAPALFEPTCKNQDCKGGGHDLTHEMMHALRRGVTELHGSTECGGSAGSAPCRFVLTYVGTATYRS